MHCNLVRREHYDALSIVSSVKAKALISAVVVTSCSEVSWLILLTQISVTEISEKLHLSEKTIRTYQYRILKKLRIKNNIGLIRLAMHDGLLDNPTHHK